MASSSSPLLSLATLVVLICLASRAESKVFNVLDYGAKGDASRDNGKALTDAWDAACDFVAERTVVVVPRGTYMLKHALLVGPCKAKTIEFQLQGDLRAYPGYYGKDHWLSFQYIDGLIVSGGGKLDGQGQTVWHHNDCRTNPYCGPFPANLRFDMISNAVVSDITSLNSKSTHINIFGSHKMNITNIKISAPADSPNTDGIHLGMVRRIRITDSTIATGDDCVSFSPGTNIANIYRVICGPGHGISIGSLGRGSDGETVTRVRVKDSTFVSTDNGVRVKTWPDSKTGLVDTLIFENIGMKNVSNPIIIDQEYCPISSCNLQVPSRVQVKNVLFNNIWGTSSTEVAVNLKCSRSNPCQNVLLEDINLRYNKEDGKVIAQCFNVKGSAKGRQNPQSCV